MRHFKSIGHRSVSFVHGQVSNHFRPCWHRLRACHYREIMHRRFEDWRSITGAAGITTPRQ